ncbi:hypothetical protein B9Z43_08240 [Limnohabitans sp. MMS-10A-192]|uniref:DUF6900 domain-containing protein n=1 Tax=Limnohabitans sp. MMS-10A-192 TaxID=1835769 RepID=UPI000D3BB7D7|nr:hypothetical protein [Limnohabitans sp. MMS-10A-192]PUE19801.1 hypothetical protein B9Z43_08240 [Limnohabitans sp. MMS-10A-192]
MNKAPTPDVLFKRLAKEHLFIDTLQTQHSDRLDFHDVSVWGIKAALQAAYDAGVKATSRTSCPTQVTTNGQP